MGHWTVRAEGEEEIMNPEEGNTPEITLEAIQSAFEANPELRNGVTAQIFNKDTVSAFLETDEGLSIIAPKMDSFASKAIETFKTKTMPNIIQEEVSKLNPAETAEQKQLKQMQVQLANIEKEKHQLEMHSIAQEALTSNGLPAAFAGFVVSETPEATRHKVQNLDVEIQALVASQVEAKVGDVAHKAAPSNTDSGNTGIQTNSGKGYFDYSAEELARLADQNPSEYRRLRASAGL